MSILFFISGFILGIINGVGILTGWRAIRIYRIKKVLNEVINFAPDFCYIEDTNIINYPVANNLEGKSRLRIVKPIDQ